VLAHAGASREALATFCGHASIQTTYDRYGHLMPGGEQEAGEFLDVYLSAAASKG
jgi:integrase